MEVRCLTTWIDENIDAPTLSMVRELDRRDLAILTVGEEYTVYGTWVHNCIVCYQLLTVGQVPTPEPAHLFEITDARPSSYWLTKVTACGRTLEINYPNWLNKPGYLEALYDDEPSAIADWLHWKALIDRESAG